MFNNRGGRRTELSIYSILTMLSRRDQKIARLSEQGALKERVGVYLRLWFRWAVGVIILILLLGCGTMSEYNRVGVKMEEGQQPNARDGGQITVVCDTFCSDRRPEPLITRVEFDNGKGFKGFWRPSNDAIEKWLGSNKMVVPEGDIILRVDHHTRGAIHEKSHVPANSYFGGSTTYEWWESPTITTVINASIKKGKSYEIQTGNGGLTFREVGK